MDLVDTTDEDDDESFQPSDSDDTAQLIARSKQDQEFLDAASGGAASASSSSSSSPDDTAVAYAGQRFSDDSTSAPVVATTRRRQRISGSDDDCSDSEPDDDDDEGGDELYIRRPWKRQQTETRTPSPPIAGAAASTASCDATRPLAIPSRDLTEDDIAGENAATNWFSLSDRAKLCWSLQTEMRLRFQKLLQRDTVQEGVSTHLGHGGHLLRVYPEKQKKDDANKKEIDKDSFATTSKRKATCLIWKRDCEDLQRECVPYLTSHGTMDDSWSTLNTISVNSEDYQQDPHALHRYPRSIENDNDDEKPKPSSGESHFQPGPVPPNFLFFRLLLEGFMGYTIPRYHSRDADTPRAAVMGGAVVAALSAWRDPKIVQLFNDKIFKFPWTEDCTTKQAKKYRQTRLRLVKRINHYFIYDTNCSAFSEGDTDIFVQASPSTRQLVANIENKLASKASPFIPLIAEYLGGLDFVHGDLERFIQTLPIFADEGGQQVKWRSDEHENSGFVYALASNGLSTQYSVYKHHPIYDQDEDQQQPPLWPRNTQFIMLKHQVDLLGGLVDFDNSIAPCAFDGLDVFVAPRAAVSLKTMTQVVTPFVWQEQRNQKRILKYWKRGFAPFLIDPNCMHGIQCRHQQLDNEDNEDNDLLEINKAKIATIPRFRSTRRRFGMGARRPIPDDDPRAELNVGQPNHKRMRNIPFGDVQDMVTFQQENAEHIFICCAPTHRKQNCTEYSRIKPGGEGYYTLMLFEDEEGDAVEFLREFNSWTDDWSALVEATDVRLRAACKSCRHWYAMKKVAAYSIDLMDPNNEHFLQEEPACFAWAPEAFATYYRHRHRGAPPENQYSFYCGPSFDSRLAGRTIEGGYHSALATIGGKARHEMARHVVKTGRLEGYQKRFVYSETLDEVFRESSDLHLSSPARAPIGLNPERFVLQCESCGTFLLDSEFSVKHCELCAKKKKSAQETSEIET